MRLPRLSHLQFAVLGTLFASERSGREIRGRLREVGVRRTVAAFYQLMARLEDAGLVEGWYDQKIIRGQIIKERRYRLTKAGARAWRAACDFYLESAKAAERREGLAHV